MPSDKYKTISLENKEAWKILKEIDHQGPDWMNIVLFGTSGIHGDHTKPADIEEKVKAKDFTNEDGEPCDLEITFLIVHPRMVTLRYGNVKVKTLKELEILKRLETKSKEVVQNM